MRLQGALLLGSVGAVRTVKLCLHAAFVLKVIGKGSLVLVGLAALVARELHIQELSEEVPTRPSGVSEYKTQQIIRIFYKGISILLA